MKKRIALILSCFAVCALVLSGCGKPSLAGTSWQVSKLVLSSGEVAEGEQAYDITYRMSLTFSDETNCTMSLAYGSADGTYTVEGDTLKLNFGGNVTECTYNGKEIGIGPDKNGMMTYLTPVYK